MKKKLTEIISAYKAIFLFIPYTYYPRWFEIYCGVVAWVNLCILIYGIFSLTATK